MELVSPGSFDTISVDGLLTYDGILTISLGSTPPPVGQTYDLFDAASVAPGSTFDSITFTDPGYGGSLNYQTGVLTITAVPEPSTCALAGLAALVLAATRGLELARNRQSQTTRRQK